MSIHPFYIQTSQGYVHGRMTAKQDGLPLVLLHQTASSSAMYEGLMGALAELQADWWVVALDTPGFGNSFVPSARPTIPFYATILWEALAQLGIGRCHLFGHHTGASIALQMAHSAPQRVEQLALSGLPLLDEAQIGRLRAGLEPFVVGEDGRLLAQTWQRLRHKAPHAPLALTLRETLLTLQAGESYPLAYHAVFEQPVAEQLATLTQPVLLMAGEQDTLRACLEPAHALLPNSTLHLLPEADSYLCDLQPERVGRLLWGFLRQRNGGGTEG